MWRKALVSLSERPQLLRLSLPRRVLLKRERVRFAAGHIAIEFQGYGLNCDWLSSSVDLEARSSDHHRPSVRTCVELQKTSSQRSEELRKVSYGYIPTSTPSVKTMGGRRRSTRDFRNWEKSKAAIAALKPLPHFRSQEATRS